MLPVLFDHPERETIEFRDQLVGEGSVELRVSRNEDAIGAGTAVSPREQIARFGEKTVLED